MNAKVPMKRKRNSLPLSFGKAIDKIESLKASEDKEREEILYRLQEKQKLRRLNILARCDSETKSRVIAYLDEEGT